MTSRADDFVHGRQTYVFTYTLENVTRYFADTGSDEFYWDVNGTAWPQPFGRVTARVTMPDELDAARTGGLACYVGYQDDTRRCDVSEVDGAVTASVSDVQPYQTMTIAIGFEPETFTEFDTSYLASPWGWLQGLVALLGLGTAVVLAARTRARHLRDEPGRPVIIAEYTPPRGIDALESAVLLGHTTKAIPAEVLEQAVVGSIRIEEGPAKMFGGTRLKAVLVDPSLADGDGRMLLPGLFPNGVAGEEFEFGRTDTRFSSTAQKVLKAATSELSTRGLRRAVPASARAWPVAIAIVSAVLVLLFGIAAMVAWVTPLVPILLIVGAVTRRARRGRHGVAQAAHRRRRRGARPPARAEAVHRMGGGGPHPHAAVAAGRGTGAGRRLRPAGEAEAVREAPPVRGRVRPGEEVGRRARRALRRRQLARLVRGLDGVQRRGLLGRHLDAVVVGLGVFARRAVRRAAAPPAAGVAAGGGGGGVTAAGL